MIKYITVVKKHEENFYKVFYKNLVIGIFKFVDKEFTKYMCIISKACEYEKIDWRYKGHKDFDIWKIVSVY